MTYCGSYLYSGCTYTLAELLLDRTFSLLASILRANLCVCDAVLCLAPYVSPTEFPLRGPAAVVHSDAKTAFCTCQLNKLKGEGGDNVPRNYQRTAKSSSAPTLLMNSTSVGVSPEEVCADLCSWRQSGRHNPATAQWGTTLYYTSRTRWGLNFFLYNDDSSSSSSISRSICTNRTALVDLP